MIDGMFSIEHYSSKDNRILGFEQNKYCKIYVDDKVIQVGIGENDNGYLIYIVDCDEVILDLKLKIIKYKD